jgi:hypothetical protein
VDAIEYQCFSYNASNNNSSRREFKKLETILVDGRFKVQSFITAGVDSANNYKDSTVDFAND